MALTGLHTNWKLGSYERDRDEEIKRSENDELRNLTSDGLLTLKPYYDAKAKGGPSLAVGYGFDLLVRDNAEINKYLAAVGLGTLSTQDAQLLDEARAKRNERKADKAYLTSIRSQLTLDLDSEATATKLLDAYINERAEKDLDKFLTRYELSIGQSQERAALVSLAYNNNGVLLGSGLAAALTTSDRAEVWYQIRYQSNGGESRGTGIANRRYRESDLFGLYGTSPDESDYKAAYRMFTRHYTQVIKPYEETKFPPTSVSQPLQNKLSEATSYLTGKYASGASWDHIYVGEDNIVLAMVSTVGNDAGLKGSEANDLIIGDGGNDVLQGGSGNDTYVYESGDGDDTIDDSDGQGKILIETGSTLSGSDKKAYLEGYQERWESADEKIHYSLLDGNLKDGGTLQIDGGALGGGKITVKHFKNDDLGIHLNGAYQIALLKGGEANPYTQADVSPPTFSADMAERGSKILKVVLNKGAKAGDKIILKATGGDASLLSAVRGDDTVSFSSGQVELTLEEGQTEIAIDIGWILNSAVNDAEWRMAA